MATQMQAARAGNITQQMERVAQKEGVSAEWIRERVAKGTIVIPANINHTALDPQGVGEGLRTKINVNLGISKDENDVAREIQKAKRAIAMKAGSHYGFIQLWENGKFSKRVDRLLISHDRNGSSL